MEMNPAAKVGMVAVLALILFGLVINQLSSTTEEKGTPYIVSFQNVGGLQVKAPVFLAGVKIGHVQKLELNKDDLRVRVTMLVTRPNVTLYRARGPEDPPDAFYVYTVTGKFWSGTQAREIRDAAGRPLLELRRNWWQWESCWRWWRCGRVRSGPRSSPMA